MKLVKRFVLGFCVIVCLLQTASAVICWECRSDIDPGCGEPFDNTTLSLTDCALLFGYEHLPGVISTMCRRTFQIVHGERRYIRNCAYLGVPGIIRTKKNNIFMEHYTCNSNGCNAAGLLTSNKILVWLTMSLATVVVHNL